MNAITLLKKQHTKVTDALSKIAEGKSSRVSELQGIADELVAHMVIEEKVFYPRAREVIPSLAKEAFEEHAVARFELSRLLAATPSERKTRAKVLKELLEHHIEEEEKELFPKMKSALDASELSSMGEQMEAMFEAAVSRGHAAFVSARDQSLRTRMPSELRRVSMNHMRA